MKRSKEQFEAEFLERMRDMFLEQYGRSPISQDEFTAFVTKHGSDVVARLRLEDKPDVKHLAGDNHTTNRNLDQYRS